MRIAKGLGVVFMGAGAIVMVVAFFASLELGMLKTFGLARENARTDITRETNQYVDSTQTQLLNLLSEYYRASSDGQRKAIVGSMWDLRARIDEERVPAEVVQFLASHPRGSQ